MEVLIHSLLCLVGLVVLKAIYELVRSNRVLIVEDSPDEQLLMRMNLRIPNSVFDYVESLEEIRFNQLWINQPDLVIVDYHLGGTAKGSILVEHCENNGIPVRLITADEREILGVSEDKIIRKEPGQKFYQKLSEWACSELKIA